MTDNFFVGCPAKSGPGFREMTNYYPNTVMNEQIRFNNNIRRDDEYRLFLQQNAEDLEKKEWNYLRTNYSCFPNECIFDNKRTLVHPRVFNEELTRYNQLAKNLPIEEKVEFHHRFFQRDRFDTGKKINIVPENKQFVCKNYKDNNLF